MGAVGVARVNTLQSYLRLARISNLPTVWSNVLAAAVLAGGSGAAPQTIVLVMLAMSLFYTGGMFLNDAFDQEIDARERPGRPLPAKAVSAMSVWTAGVAMMVLGMAIMFYFSATAGAASIALAAAILIYDAWHKGNAVAPFIMGACRALVYVTTAIAVGQTTVTLAALALLAYVAGLTFAAKQEAFDRVEAWWPFVMLAAPAVYAVSVTGNLASTLPFVAAAVGAIGIALHYLRRRRPDDIGRAVSLLIAGVALGDAALVSTVGSTTIALLCCGLFLLTLALQRVIPGT